MSGRGGSNRKSRQRFSNRKDDSGKQAKKHGDNIYPDDKFEKNPAAALNTASTVIPASPVRDRPQWTAPVLPANPINTPDCPWCEKPIKDITTAICDKETGRPVHFDCVIARITEMENLEPNDGICYIGGGRFGIVHYNNPPDTRDFSIKKIYEWETKDSNNEWRRPISEYFSIT